MMLSLCACTRSDLADGVAALGVDPTSLQFGMVAVGFPVTAPVTILSTGDVPATVQSVWVRGDESRDFTMPGGAFEPVRLAPGASLKVEISLGPSAAGDVEATLAIESDAEMPELIVPLSGTGTVPCSETNADFCARVGGCGAVTGVDRCGVARTADCSSCPRIPEPPGPKPTPKPKPAPHVNPPDAGPGCTEDDAAFCKRLGKNCGDVTALDLCGNSRTASCGPSVPAGSSNALVLDVPDDCINDTGITAVGDSLEVYCLDNVMRFCLSGESCPWRDGTSPPTDSTCSPSGLWNPAMASIFTQPECRQGLDVATVCCYPNGVALLTQMMDCPATPPQ
jgi:hypothetical protein